MASANLLPEVTTLRRIPTPGGDVFHAMKVVDLGFAGFGEAYFTSIDEGSVKGWKRHNLMTMNLVVPSGRIQISVRGDEGAPVGDYQLGPDDPAHYIRLTVPPKLWVAFGGLGAGVNLMLNIANMPHDPTEADNVAIDTFPWVWAPQ